MRVLNFGSLNIDHVYKVDHFVVPGETLSSDSYTVFSGGKGANQSLALARAGARVCHAGLIGRDGGWLKDKLADADVDVSYVNPIDAATGHAIIQVTNKGENAIVLHGGANQLVSREYAERILENFGSQDILLIQNEISAIPDIIELARARGLRVFFNPAPMSPDVLNYPLEMVDSFILNEIEGQGITGEKNPEDILQAMKERFPSSATVLTLGSKGVRYVDPELSAQIDAEKVDVVDTTAAGDTFIGYYLAQLVQGSSVEECLRAGSRAAAIAVTRQGAADSIPTRDEVSL